MTTVYVSGPFAKPDPCVNTHTAIEAASQLMDAGLIPYVPHLTMLWHVVMPRPYEDWMAIDLTFVALCDYFLRLPGESPGADREEALANELGKPVFHSVDELLYCKDK